jgi:hypothetical protein
MILALGRQPIRWLEALGSCCREQGGPWVRSSANVRLQYSLLPRMTGGQSGETTTLLEPGAASAAPWGRMGSLCTPEILLAGR